MVQIRQQMALELMREADIGTVQEIEKEIFSTPWPRNAYYRELASRNTAHYIVLRRDAEIIGYGGGGGGARAGTDQPPGHTSGFRRDQQRGGYGRIVFAALIQAAYDLGAKWITLEVRTSNENAQRMYENFGFKVIGR